MLRHPLLSGIALSLIFSSLLAMTFGWIGTVFLNVPGIYFGMAIRASGDHHIQLVVLIGDWVFYSLVFWCVLSVRRRLRFFAGK